MSASKRSAAPVNDNSTNQPSSQSFTIPSTAVIGDIVVFAMGQNTGTQTFSSPPGWTELTPQTVSATNMASQVWAKKLETGDPGSSVTFTTTGGGRMVAAYMVVQGAGALEDIIVPTSVMGASTNPFTPSSVDTPAADYFIIKIGFVRSALTTQVTLSGTSDLTEDAECNTNFTTSPNFALGMYHRTANTGAAGNYGGAQLTASQAITGSHGYTLAIPSASTPPPGSDTGMRVRVVKEDGAVITVNVYAVKADGTLAQVSG